MHHDEANQAVYGQGATPRMSFEGRAPQPGGAQAAAVRASSRREGHTARAPAAAPTRITISNVWIEAEGRIPVYLAPGVTHVTVEACVITGRSRSVALVGLFLHVEMPEVYPTLEAAYAHVREKRELRPDEWHETPKPMLAAAAARAFERAGRP